ncbi:MAG: hypothetical protein WCR44_04555 [Verrucomicrobiota bacterium]
MSTTETDPNTEFLKSIALSLKSIQSTLESLTGAVEGVAESIEKAHEPEGDLGVHLVASLKELTSALQKRAQQERNPQSQQQGQRQQNQQGGSGGGRRDGHQRGRQQENRQPYQPQQDRDQTDRTEDRHQDDRHPGDFEEHEGSTQPSVPSYREDRGDSEIENRHEQSEEPASSANTAKPDGESTTVPAKQPRPNSRPNRRRGGK